MTASTPGTTRPTVLFVSTRGAGRSQMAAAYLSHLGNGAIESRSAGTQPAAGVDPAVVEAMAEDGVDISAAQPEPVTADAVNEAQMVVTLGSADECPVIPGRRYEDWDADDPKGKGLDDVRPVRDDIKHRVQQLIAELQPALHPDAQ